MGADEALHADLDLLERIAMRDASAVAALYDRHARTLYSLVHHILRDSAEAEDVLQEVFLRVWEKAATYDPVLGSPMAWLVRIARNRAIDRVRSRRSRPVTQSADETLDDRLFDTVRPAPDLEQRVLIEQAFFMGFTQSELAARFNLPLGTVKTRIRTGMLAMREHLQHLV